MKQSEKPDATLTTRLSQREKAAFVEACAAKDITPSQVVRHLVRKWLAVNGKGA